MTTDDPSAYPFIDRSPNLGPDLLSTFLGDQSVATAEPIPAGGPSHPDLNFCARADLSPVAFSRHENMNKPQRMMTEQEFQEDFKVSRHLFFSWPLNETTIGKALGEYERALVEECVADQSQALDLHRKTFVLRELLTAEIMKLMAASVLPKPIWLERELDRLGVVSPATEI